MKGKGVQEFKEFKEFKGVQEFKEFKEFKDILLKVKRNLEVKKYGMRIGVLAQGIAMRPPSELLQLLELLNSFFFQTNSPVCCSQAFSVFCISMAIVIV